MTIQLKVVPSETAKQSRYVEVINHSATSQHAGYRIGGAFSGPKLLVAADAALLDSVFERLSNLPTLPWMRGELWMINLTSLNETAVSHLPNSIWDAPFDETILLPFVTDERPEKPTVTAAYWTVLRLCSDLGMISGRGVHMVGNSNFAHRRAVPHLRLA